MMRLAETTVIARWRCGNCTICDENDCNRECERLARNTGISRRLVIVLSYSTQGRIGNF